MREVRGSCGRSGARGVLTRPRAIARGAEIHARAVPSVQDPWVFRRAIERTDGHHDVLRVVEVQGFHGALVVAEEPAGRHGFDGVLIEEHHRRGSLEALRARQKFRRQIYEWCVSDVASVVLPSAKSQTGRFFIYTGSSVRFPETRLARLPGERRLDALR